MVVFLQIQDIGEKILNLFYEHLRCCRLHQNVGVKIRNHLLNVEKDLARGKGVDVVMKSLVIHIAMVVVIIMMVTIMDQEIVRRR